MAVPKTAAELVALIVDLANQPTSFHPLTKRLYRLLTASPEDFKKVVTSGVVGKRRAYQLVRIARVFGPTKISPSDLETAGFTKLDLIAKKHEKAEKAYILDVAEIVHLLAWALSILLRHFAIAFLMITIRRRSASSNSTSRRQTTLCTARL